MTQKLIENIEIGHLRNLIRSYAVSRVFLVTGKNSHHLSGAKDFIEKSVVGYDMVVFSNFEQNPKFEDALIGMNLFRKSKCEIIIAIGGGSVLDMAKLINIFAANQQVDPLEIVQNSKTITSKGVPIVAIPTTAGTGSEATHFAVVYHNKKKYSVANKFILPDVVGLNAIFTMSQPKYLTACSGLDAFSQAIESFWSVGATEESKSYAKKALRLLLPNLKKSVNSPNKENRENVLKGAYWAGRAINISKTTAPHAVSYAFTTYYSIPHGHAVFLTLPEFFEYNYSVTPEDNNHPEGISKVRENFKELCEIFGIGSPLAGKEFLINYARDIGIELSLKNLGINNYTAKITSNVNLERLGNNPRNISKEALSVLLMKKSDHAKKNP